MCPSLLDCSSPHSTMDTCSPLLTSLERFQLRFPQTARATQFHEHIWRESRDRPASKEQELPTQVGQREEMDEARRELLDVLIEWHLQLPSWLEELATPCLSLESPLRRLPPEHRTRILTESADTDELVQGSCA